MQTAADILDRLGGYASVADNTGFPVTTVHSWQRVNFIPEWRRPALIALAKKRKIDLGEGDFPAKQSRESAQPHPKPDRSAAVA